MLFSADVESVSLHGAVLIKKKRNNKTLLITLCPTKKVFLYVKGNHINCHNSQTFLTFQRYRHFRRQTLELLPLQQWTSLTHITINDKNKVRYL